MAACKRAANGGLSLQFVPILRASSCAAESYDKIPAISKRRISSQYRMVVPKSILPGKREKGEGENQIAFFHPDPFPPPSRDCVAIRRAHVGGHPGRYDHRKNRIILESFALSNTLDSRFHGNDGPFPSL